MRIVRQDRKEFRSREKHMSEEEKKEKKEWDKDWEYVEEKEDEEKEDEDKKCQKQRWRSQPPVQRATPMQASRSCRRVQTGSRKKPGSILLRRGT